MRVLGLVEPVREVFEISGFRDDPLDFRADEVDPRPRSSRSAERPCKPRLPLSWPGLFFFALQPLSPDPEPLAGRRLRERIAALTARPIAGLSIGAVLIVITQSGSASVFILVGMVRAGMLTLMQAQSVLIGVNAGSSLVLFFLTFDIEIAILVLIGISGIAYAYGDAGTTRIVAGSVLGIALLFFGLEIMRDGVAPLAGESWFTDAIRSTSGSPIIAFVVGAALSFVVQSSLAAIVVMIAFHEAGLFGLPEAVMFVYGANLGSSFLLALLSAKVTGVAKQVALCTRSRTTSSAR